MPKNWVTMAGGSSGFAGMVLAAVYAHTTLRSVVLSVAALLVGSAFILVPAGVNRRTEKHGISAPGVMLGKAVKK